jgi:DNA repair protein RadC
MTSGISGAPYHPGVNHPQGANAPLRSDQALEKAAVAGGAAIQRLIAERNALRGRVTAQERELAALRTTAQNQRHCINGIREHYIELANKIVSEMERIAEAIQASVPESQANPSQPGQADEASDSTLISLAQRLSPHFENRSKEQGGK